VPLVTRADEAPIRRSSGVHFSRLLESADEQPAAELQRVTSVLTEAPRKINGCVYFRATPRVPRSLPAVPAVLLYELARAVALRPARVY